MYPDHQTNRPFARRREGGQTRPSRGGICWGGGGGRAGWRTFGESANSPRKAYWCTGESVFPFLGKKTNMLGPDSASRRRKGGSARRGSEKDAFLNVTSGSYGGRFRLPMQRQRGGRAKRQPERGKGKTHWATGGLVGRLTQDHGKLEGLARQRGRAVCRPCHARG
jgi:hypothetical protein